MSRTPNTTLALRVWRWFFLGFCALVLVFLATPILVIVPLSFNTEPYFTFTRAMLHLDPAGFSLHWYHSFLQSPDWMLALRNSFVVAISAAGVATLFGTSAALGLSRAAMPWRRVITSLLIAPMIVPVVVSGAGMFFFYASIGLVHSLLGIILAHAALGAPFVVITVSATLVSFDATLIRASASLGASPLQTVLHVVMPLVLPGIASGALLAFVTSFDEIVIVLFLADYNQRTIPIQMWNGVREQLSPVILAAATLLILASVAILVLVELLRRRSERLQGVGEQAVTS
jgi:putative spermidine/putrescine transport system permease protein